MMLGERARRSFLEALQTERHALQLAVDAAEARARAGKDDADRAERAAAADEARLAPVLADNDALRARLARAQGVPPRKPLEGTDWFLIVVLVLIFIWGVTMR